MAARPRDDEGELPLPVRHQPPAAIAIAIALEGGAFHGLLALRRAARGPLHVRIRQHPAQGALPWLPLHARGCRLLPPGAGARGWRHPWLPPLPSPSYGEMPVLQHQSPQSQEGETLNPKPERTKRTLLFSPWGILCTHNLASSSGEWSLLQAMFSGVHEEQCAISFGTIPCRGRRKADGSYSARFLQKIPTMMRRGNRASMNLELDLHVKRDGFNMCTFWNARKQAYYADP